jgi:hypothetical protein
VKQKRIIGEKEREPYMGPGAGLGNPVGDYQTPDRMADPLENLTVLQSFPTLRKALLIASLIILTTIVTILLA